MESILYHGSNHTIEQPLYGLGKTTNDYGRGFYCTRELELAKEWGCAGGLDGFANEYVLERADELSVLRLNEEPYNILNWLALLADNGRRPEASMANRKQTEILKNLADGIEISG